MTFGPEKKDIFERFIGKYVLITPRSSNLTYAGKLKEIIGEYLVLNPHQGAEYTEDGLTKKIVDSDEIITAPEIMSIEEITEKNLRDWCEWDNKMRQEELRKVRASKQEGK